MIKWLIPIFFCSLAQAQIISVEVENPKSNQFNYNQRWAKVLIEVLEQQDFAGNLINGAEVDINKRAQLASQSSLLLSIQQDSSNNGFSLMVSSKNKEFQQSYKCAQSIARFLLPSFRPNLHSSHKPRLNPKYPVYAFDNDIILRGSTVPAIRIEVGHIDEAQFSKAVALGIRECFQ